MVNKDGEQAVTFSKNPHALSAGNLGIGGLVSQEMSGKQGDKSQEQAKQGVMFLPLFISLNFSLIYFYSNLQNMLTSPNSSTSSTISLVAVTRGG